MLLPRVRGRLRYNAILWPAISSHSVVGQNDPYIQQHRSRKRKEDRRIRPQRAVALPSIKLPVDESHNGEHITS